MNGWNRLIRDARDWHDLLQIARDYVAQLEPWEWHSIPEEARPTRIKGTDDLEFWRQKLADAYLEVASQPQVNEVLRGLLAFFTSAAERAGEMYGTATPPEKSATNDAGGAPRKTLGKRQE